MKQGAVAVLGLGLMGGSVARALRARDPHVRICAWTPDGDDPAQAARERVIDRAARDVGDAVRDAGLVVLAAPVGASAQLLGTIAAMLPDDAVVTDVCSVKMPLQVAAGAAVLSHRFCGAHPLCGSHRSGWAASSPGLYEGRRVFIVPSSDDATTARIEQFWTGLGAETERIDAGRHDALMARASHLPQIFASALATTLARERIPRSRLGPGGLDCTRLAASQPELWADLLLSNGPEVRAALAAARRTLNEFAGALEQGDALSLRRLLRRGNAWTEEAS